MSESVTIPTKTWKRIERVLDGLAKPNLITEADAINLLQVQKKTFQNYLSNGTIPPAYYRIGAAGKRFYDKDLLTGLKKAV